MQLENVGLRERPFHKEGWPTTFVRYRSQQAAFKFLGTVLTDDRGIGLLHGRESSGKSVLVNQFAKELRSGQTVAIVDGARLKTPQLLSNILTQFGYNIELNSEDELLNMLNVFAVQQTRSEQAPLLIVENINEMYPSALNTLCKLASLLTGSRYALRIVLTGTRDFRRIIYSASMSAIEQRMVGDFELGPLTAGETLNYLYSKLRSCGVRRPDDIFPVDVCDRIHAASGGWPGELDSIAMSLMDRADDLPLLQQQDVAAADKKTADLPPRLIVTVAGEAAREIELLAPRAVIGRSDLCDIVIADQFISKQHALIIREHNVVSLVDLKSANGTYVNSRRVQRVFLRDNDIISLGDHRIKMVYANCQVPAGMEDQYLADTATMKNVGDARRAKNKAGLRIAAVGKRKA